MGDWKEIKKLKIILIKITYQDPSYVAYNWRAYASDFFLKLLNSMFYYINEENSTRKWD